MRNQSFLTSGNFRALAIFIAAAGTLSGCVSDTVKSATSGTDSASAASRTLSFVDAPAIDLGTVSGGSTQLIRLSVATTGTGDATISSTSNSNSNFTFNGGSFPGAGGTCAQPINGNCSVALLFTAPAGIGIYSNVVTLAYTSGGATGSLSLTISATVTLAPSLSINGMAPYNYGTKNVATNTDASLNVTNVGGIGASSVSFTGLSAPMAFKGGAYPGTGGNCGNFIASGASCTIVVTYSPTAAGSSTRTLTTSYSDGTAAQSSSVTVSGTAVTLAALSFLTPVVSPYDFGNVTVGSTMDVTFTLSNGGGQTANALTLSGFGVPFAYKGGAFPGTGGTCGTSLTTSSSCTFVVTYSPTAAGLSTKTVDVAYDNGSGSTIHLTKGIQGTGIISALLGISDSPTYDYGSHPIGSATDATLIVTNSGGSVATALALSGLAAPLNYKGGSYPGTAGTCATSLAASATCTLVITFSPTASTVSNATLFIAYNDGSAAVSTTRALTGRGGTVAVLTFNAGTDYNFGAKGIGTSTDATINLANSGTLSATAVNLTGLSAPMTYKGGAFPGTGGTCAATIAASATCTVVITYAPTAAVVTTEPLTVGYYNSATTTSTVKNVIGTGLSYASLAITSPAANPYDYGNVTINSPTDAPFTITNSGGQTASAFSAIGLSGAMLFKGGTFPGVGGTCAATLSAAATCTFVVTFTPTAPVVITKTFDLAYADASGSTVHLTRTIQGTGVSAATLAISNGPNYDYGSRTIGSATDANFTVTNSGGSPATAATVTGLSAPLAFKGGTYPGTGGNCAATISANSTCTLIVTYSPTASAVTSETLTLGYNDGAITQSTTRSLTGTGGSLAVLTLNAGATYAFGSKNVGSSSDATITIANTGTLTASTITLSALSVPLTFKGGTSPGTGGTCSATLAGSTSCTIVLTYAPTTAGSASSTLTIGYFNTSSTTSTAQSITGTGVALASLAITSPLADPFNYGSVTIGAAGVDQTFTVANSGGQAALSLVPSGLAAPFNFKGGAYPGSGGTCAATLNAAATCTIIATFLPTTPGLNSDSLAIAYDDGSGSTIHLPHGVQGTGSNQAVLSISDGPSYDFGSKSIGTATDHTFNVTNSVGSPATSLAGATLTSPFLYKGGAFPGTGGNCGASLASGAVCSVVVEFSPTGTGGFSGTFTVNYNGGLSAQSTDRAMTGTGGSVANLTISDGTTYNYGSIVKGYSLTKTFTVTNVGGASASAISGAAFSAPYAYLGGTFPGTGGTCGTTLGISGSCTILITFAPTAATNSTATLTLSYSDSVNPATSTRPLTGTGATILKIAGGTSHTCALYSTGTVKCWGSNFYGQLGDGTNIDNGSPVTVVGITTASDLAVGANHSCAMLTSGRAYCWGADNNGQLGNDATLANVTSPAQVALYTDFSQISAGGDVTCGLRGGGTIVCWGDDSEGANGNNAAFTNNPTPVAVSGLISMTDVSVGRGHACARNSGNTFRCWGSNTYGQLGNGSTTNSGVPVTTAPGTALSSAAGGDVSCALLSGGTVKCWGADDMGQLGDNPALASKTSPTTVPGLANVSSIKMGLKHGCALTSGNTVVCWGRDTYGQLGDNPSFTNQPTPVAVSMLSSVASIGTGENHSCAVLNSGLVYCWGQNNSSQLGDLSTTNQPTPVLVQGL